MRIRFGGLGLRRVSRVGFDRDLGCMVLTVARINGIVRDEIGSGSWVG